MKPHMIPLIALQEDTPDWQKQLARAITDPNELFAHLRLDPNAWPETLAAGHSFKLKVTHSYLHRIEPGNPKDPLLLQVLPQGAELAPQPPEYDTDPVGDIDAMPHPGIVHKYRGRILLIATGSCAIHCRYCFRRHFPYASAHPARHHWQTTIDYLQAHPDIDEVILSGGDPLVLSDAKLGELIARLQSLPQLRRLRLHSRLPIVLPDRITPQLLALLSQTRLRCILVVHCNHANEIDDAVREALLRLHAAGVLVLNQSVLLKHINDQVDSLAALSLKLFDAQVQPYYLHLLDRVSGAAHFAVSPDRARTLQTALSGRLPGYLLPRFVYEVAGGTAKTPL